MSGKYSFILQVLDKSNSQELLFSFFRIKLRNDLIDWLSQQHLGFSSDLVNTRGQRFVGLIEELFWYHFFKSGSHGFQLRFSNFVILIRYLSDSRYEVLMSRLSKCVPSCMAQFCSRNNPAASHHSHLYFSQSDLRPLFEQLGGVLVEGWFLQQK